MLNRLLSQDFERGFIRAETVSYKDLVECGSENAAKEKVSLPHTRSTLSCRPTSRHWQGLPILSRASTASNIYRMFNGMHRGKGIFLFVNTRTPGQVEVRREGIRRAGWGLSPLPLQRLDQTRQYIKTSELEDHSASLILS